MTTDREFDLVVFGATGFVGNLIAHYLAEHAPSHGRFCLAGRDENKLARLREDLGERAAHWQVRRADATDTASLQELATSSRVVITTVGPYATHGLALVLACARAGTHYADLSGELLFVREAIDAGDRLAQDSGARLVHACGYDSIPSDLGVLLVHQCAERAGAGELTDVTCVASMRGGLSGGTMPSVRGHVRAVSRNPDARRLAADPFALSPDRDREPALAQPSDAPLPARRGPRRQWTGPFLMSSFNTRVVRRSNALSDYAYGRGLRYGEVMATGGGITGASAAVGLTAGLGVLVAGLAAPLPGPVLRRMLPAAGEGPSARTRQRGWFRMELQASAASGARITAEIAGTGDPGYNATAVMMGQTALCLAFEQELLPQRYGSLTPATAMGTALLQRLRDAGQTYRAELVPGPARRSQ